LALLNVSSSPLSVQLYVYNSDGTSTGLSTTVNLPANGETTQFIDELFQQLPVPFHGIVEVTSLNGFVITAALRGRWNSRGDFLMTTTPPSNQFAAPAGQETDFPLILAGAEYPEQIILFSATTQSTAGSLQVFSSSGTVPSNQTLVLNY
jgi:hypothetical protein